MVKVVTTPPLHHEAKPYDHYYAFVQRTQDAAGLPAQAPRPSTPPACPRHPAAGRRPFLVHHRGRPVLLQPHHRSLEDPLPAGPRPRPARPPRRGTPPVGGPLGRPGGRLGPHHH